VVAGDENCPMPGDRGLTPGRDLNGRLAMLGLSLGIACPLLIRAAHLTGCSIAAAGACGKPEERIFRILPPAHGPLPPPHRWSRSCWARRLKAIKPGASDPGFFKAAGRPADPGGAEPASTANGEPSVMELFGPNCAPTATWPPPDGNPPEPHATGHLRGLAGVARGVQRATVPTWCSFTGRHQARPSPQPSAASTSRSPVGL